MAECNKTHDLIIYSDLQFTHKDITSTEYAKTKSLDSNNQHFKSKKQENKSTSKGQD